MAHVMAVLAASKIEAAHRDALELAHDQVTTLNRTNGLDARDALALAPRWWRSIGPMVWRSSR